ncbi:hypothetical protein MYX76_09495 [Desulfobacterota bacterium AH_259_B03_O07]|nr:hypothetical protein [Desulfobacterota bacterium AH_259_B03_O07]
MHKSLAIKDKSLHRELKKLAADLGVLIKDLLEDFIRERIKRKNGDKEAEKRDGTNSARPQTLAEYIHGYPEKDKLWKIACPSCDEYLDVRQWDCPLEHHNHDRSLITDGCDICGMKFGDGEMDIQGRECSNCEHEIDFFDPYEFHNWSVLNKGENSEQEFLEKFRVTDWTQASIIVLVIWVVLFGYLFFVSKSITLDSTRFIVFIVGLLVIITILIMQLRYKKPLRNPKYRGPDD